MPIPISKPYLPSRDVLDSYIDQIYESNWLSNNGPLVQELTKRLEEKLSTENILLVANGTLALQVAYKAVLSQDEQANKDIEAITTPFTFIATSNSLMWEGIKPKFSDISRDNWCLDPAKIPEKLNKKTKIIVPVHVYGNRCATEAIEKIAREHDIKTIYDASHAFGVEHNGQSIVNHGDASVVSFHATKLFHTVEGAMIKFKHKRDFERAKKIINFGLDTRKQPCTLGINAKMNEFEAAFGLTQIDNIKETIYRRKEIGNIYEELLSRNKNIECISRSDNQAYLPVLFDSEACALEKSQELKFNNIETRRYFYPSLDTVPHLRGEYDCPISQDVAKRILCLPIYDHIKKDDIINICGIING